ncbi:MAG: hypothetical protein RLZ73_1808 [Bacteroidota bacterium]
MVSGKWLMIIHHSSFTIYHLLWSKSLHILLPTHQKRSADQVDAIRDGWENGLKTLCRCNTGWLGKRPQDIV